MASNIYALQCPCCGRSAFEEYYYKSGEQFTFCMRCGYNFSKTNVSETADRLGYKEEKKRFEGHGVFILVKKDGSRKSMMLNRRITAEELQEYGASFKSEDVNQEKSYLVSYEDGVFTILLGNPPENFYLSFDEYRVKMFAKYGTPEFDFMVPIEE